MQAFLGASVDTYPLAGVHSISRSSVGLGGKETFCLFVSKSVFFFFFLIALDLGVLA